jgi:hypothetical protein
LNVILVGASRNQKVKGDSDDDDDDDNNNNNNNNFNNKTNTNILAPVSKRNINILLI